MSVFEILSNQSFIGAFLSVAVFMALGYFLKKKNIITIEGQKGITFLVMNIGLPALVFKSFMSDFDGQVFKTNFIVMLLAFICYILLFIIGNLIFYKRSKSQRKIYSIIMTLSQVSLFSMPIVEAIYKTNESLVPISMVSIIFRIFLYGYSYIVFSNVSNEKTNVTSQIKKIFLNPIVIAMLLGIFVWVTQSFMPKVTIEQIKVSFLRIDVTLPAVYTIIKYASNITTPLSMMLIGMTIGSHSIKKSITSKDVWILSLIRSFGGPAVMLVLIVLTQKVFGVNFNTHQVAGLLFAFAAPVSAVVNTYAINFKQEEFVCSSSCLLSSVFCIITFPILYLIINLIL